MAFKMNSSRISLRGSADTPGLFSTNDTDNISSGPGMGAQAPVGPGSQGEAMSNMNTPGPTYMIDGGTMAYQKKDEFGTTIPEGEQSAPEVVGTLNRKDMKMKRNNSSKGKKVGDNYSTNEDIRDGSGNKISQKVTKVKKIPKKSQTQTKVEKPKEIEITRRAGSVEFT